MSPAKFGSLNRFFDEWRALIYIATAIGVFGGGVVIPNMRISELKAEQVADRNAINETSRYLRVLATAQCVSDESPKNKLLEELCERVVADLTTPPALR